MAYEENSDLFSNDKTTLNLNIERIRLVRAIEKLVEEIEALNSKIAEPKARIANFQKEIDEVLWPRVQNASHKVDDARQDLEDCQSQQ